MRGGLLALFLLVGLLGSSLVGPAASSAAIPLNYLVVTDQQGPNDVNSDQVDLTLMGRDDSDPTYSKYVWNWDSITSWTGTGQTGDACALYDTNGDGKINYAICVRIANATATTTVQSPSSPFVFTCTNARADRCSQPTGPLSYTAADVQATSLAGAASPPASLVTDTDPFLAGQSFPYDSTILLNVRKAFLPTGAVLVNVCSYPSAGNGGNNNPFDCITPPSAGLLRIVKDAGADTTTPFPFTVNPVPNGVPANYTITGSGQTAPISVAIGTTSVSEAVPAGWALDGVTCVKSGGSTTGTRSGNSITSVAIESGQLTTCTFKDVKNNPAMTVDKQSTTTSITAAGQVVPYTFLVKNTGNVTLTSIVVTDPKVATITCPATTLAPGASMTCSGSHTVTQAEMDAASGTLVNTVTVTSAQAPPATDTNTIPVAKSPSMTVDKQSTTTSITAAGQIVPYTFLVKNTGNVTLTNIAASDPKVATVSCPKTTLAPGESMTCTGSHTVTQAEIDAPSGTLVNTVTVTSTQAPPATDTNTIPVTKTATLSIDKQSTTTSITAAGQVVPYTFLVKNIGNVTLTGVTVTDPKVATITCPKTTLTPSETMTCSGSHTVTQAEMDAASGTLVNTATADSDQSGPATDTNTIPVAQTKTMTVDKQSTTTAITAAGQIVPYTFLVKNTGNVTLTNVAATDPKVPAVSCPKTTLAPGESMTCTGSHTVTQAEIDAPSGTLVNTVTVTSTQAPPATDTNTIPVTKTATLSIDKQSTTTSITAAGQVVPYTFLVKNTGNVTLTGVTVTDPKVATVTCPKTTLTPSETMTCSGSHTVTQAEMDAASGTLVNTATADSDQSGPATDTNTIPVAQTAKLTVDKQSTTTSITAAGQVVPYTFLVTNTGNVTLTGVTVTDPKVTTITCPVTTLAPGSSTTCSGSHTVTQAEMDAASGTLVNTATADSDQSGPATDTNTIPVTQTKTMTVDKQSTTTAITAAGQIVPYTFLVKNTGNVTLTNIAATDPKVPAVSCPKTTLAPGESMTCTGSHTVTQAEIDAGGNLVNTVTVTSTQAPPATDTNTIPVTQTKSMTVDKQSTTTAITAAGQVVPYTFLVTNTGNVTLTNVAASDPKVPAVSCPKTTLAPGESMTCTGSHTVTQAEIDAGGNLVNTVTVTSTQAPPATDTNTIPVTQTKTLSIDKQSTTTSITAAGQVVPYTFIVTNTGNVTLTQVAVTDPKVPSVSCPKTTLAPGESMTCTGSHTVTQAEIDAPSATLVNTATADSLESPPATDTNTIPVTQTRKLTLVKAADKTSVGAGDQIKYTLTYGNTGNATATGTKINETVPAGTTYVSCTGGCIVDGSTVTWDVGSVGPGGGGSVTLTVAVSPDINSCAVCNVATITSPDQAGTTSSNQVCAAAQPSSDPSTAKANGDALGLRAYVPLLGIPLVNQNISHASSTRTGVGASAADDQFLHLDILGVVGLTSVAKADVLNTSSSSQVTKALGARQTTTSEVLGLDVLSGVVTADTVRSVAATSASGTASSYSAAGTTLTNLKVLGSSVVNPAPGAKIPLDNNLVNKALYGKGSYVAINEQTGSTSSPASGQLSGGTYKADLTVTAIRVYITGGTIGGLLTAGGPPVEITVAKSVAHAEHKQTTLCATNPNNGVSGHAFVASAQVDPLLPAATVGFVDIPASGGSAHMDVPAWLLPSDGSVVTTSDAASDTTGTNGATASTSSSYAQAAGVCLLKVAAPGCLVKATLVRSQSNSTASSGARSSNATGTQFVDLVVAGVPISGTPPPNTTITLPLGLGYVVLNEQTPDAPETGHTGLTVRAIHIKLTTPLAPLLTGAEVIVAEAHSDALWR